MNIKIEKRVNRIMVSVEGNLDAENARELEKITESLLDDNDQLIILDLGNVRDIKPAGVEALLTLYAVASRKAANEALKAMAVIRFINISPEIRSKLEKTVLSESIGDPETESEPMSPLPEKAQYEELLEKVRAGFPPPVSDPVRDAYFVQTIARGLNRIDDFKTDRPYLGERVEINYDTARSKRLPENISTLEKTIEQLADYMQGIVIWGHPRSQENVTPPPTIASIVGQLYASIYNPNIIWDNYSHRVSQAEVELVSMCSDLIGYDQKKAAGVATFGGTGTVLYGAKIGLEKALPGSFKTGVQKKAKIICSDVGHYAKLSVLGWLGLGTDNLVSIPTDRDNSMDLAVFEQKMRELLDNGEHIACIIATMGTTDAFGIDNLEYIVSMRDKLAEEYQLSYSPHIHADAVIGWAWAVFNDYDFDANPMGFNPRTLRSLYDTSANISILNMADSVGFDFHKTGYGPYISSLFLCRNNKDLNLITRDKDLMPYLFQFGGYQPGLFTLETSRSGGSVLSALGTLKMLGKEGFRTILGHIVAMAELLRARIEEIPYAHLVNSYNYGPVTLFRIYPGDTDAKAAYRSEIHEPELAGSLEEHNEYNKRIAAELTSQMESGNGFAISYTSSYRYTSYGKPILALKSFIMSPFVEENTMNYLLDCIDEAKKVVDREMRFAQHRKAKAEKKI